MALPLTTSFRLQSLVEGRASRRAIDPVARPRPAVFCSAMTAWLVWQPAGSIRVLQPVAEVESLCCIRLTASPRSPMVIVLVSVTGGCVVDDELGAGLVVLFRDDEVGFVVGHRSLTSMCRVRRRAGACRVELSCSPTCSPRSVTSWSCRHPAPNIPPAPPLPLPPQTTVRRPHVHPLSVCRVLARRGGPSLDLTPPLVPGCPAQVTNTSHPVSH